MPAGSLYFLIVGTNTASTESSWGVDSDGDERHGDAASGVCLISKKNTQASCP